MDNFIKRYNLKKVHAYLDDITVTGSTVEEHDLNLKRLLDAAHACNLTLNEKKSKLRSTTIDMLGYHISHNEVKLNPTRLQPLLDLYPPSTMKELKCISSLFSYYARWIPKFAEKAGPSLHTQEFSPL